MRKFGIILLASTLALLGLAAFELKTEAPTPSAEAAGQIQWMSWEEVQQKMEKEPRKVFIDIYTDWCGWCKVMDRNTFQQDHIARYLNENFYCIKFNAEQKEAVELNGKTYKFVDNGRRGYHQLAAFLTNGNLSYPTFAFMDKNLEVIQPISGYQEPDVFERIMTYFATDSYKNTPWGKYEKEYQLMDKE